MKKIDFAFIVHSRGRSDLKRRYPVLKFVPNIIFDLISKNLKPINVSFITGLQNNEGQESLGAVIGIPMTARQLMENRDLALRRILQAVKKAKSKGAKYVGLGAMTASLSKGGRDVIQHVPGVFVTTGRTFTIINIVDYVLSMTKLFELSKENSIIGIVGAAGGIGSGTATVLAHHGFKNFILIDLERKLESIKNTIKIIETRHGNSCQLEISHKISEVSRCNIIIAATSAPEAVIRSEDVNPGTIIINDAQPSDISPEIVRNRKDVIVIEGGALSTDKINCHLNMGLVSKNDIFSCLAETLILTYLKFPGHYSMDHVELHSLDKFKEVAKKLNFHTNKPQNDLGYLNFDQEKIEEFKKFIKREGLKDAIIN